MGEIMNRRYANKCILSAFGADKSQILEALGGIDAGAAQIQISEKNLVAKIEVSKDNVDEVAITQVLNQIYAKIGDYIYADRDVELNALVVYALKEQGALLSIAESITGGLIASKICEVNGASEVFYEGMVTYNSGAKVRRLHVPMGLIELETAVSESVCNAMLTGVLSNKEITYAIATTGYASDMSEMNGLAYIGCGDRNERNVCEVKYKGTRNEIREKVANCALFMLYKQLEKNAAII